MTYCCSHKEEEPDDNLIDFPVSDTWREYYIQRGFMPRPDYVGTAGARPPTNGEIQEALQQRIGEWREDVLDRQARRLSQPTPIPIHRDGIVLGTKDTGVPAPKPRTTMVLPQPIIVEAD